jgi:cyclophilin family peptidyl-prolyl cis-trans isomerase
MTFELNGAPALVDHFCRLASTGFYDGTAFHAIHPEAVWGGDPRTRFGYGPEGTLVRGDYYYGKVREWGSGDDGCLRGYGQTVAEGRLFCDFSRRVAVDTDAGALRVEGGSADSRRLGTLALVLGGQPGMTLMLPRNTVGSQFCIYTQTPTASDSRDDSWGLTTSMLADTDRHPVIGALIAGADVLQALSAEPVDNGYLAEKRGRSLLGSPSYARPRDVPARRQGVRGITVPDWRPSPVKMGVSS